MLMRTPGFFLSQIVYDSAKYTQTRVVLYSFTDSSLCEIKGRENVIAAASARLRTVVILKL